MILEQLHLDKASIRHFFGMIVRRVQPAVEDDKLRVVSAMDEQLGVLKLVELRCGDIEPLFVDHLALEQHSFSLCFLL